MSRYRLPATMLILAGLAWFVFNPPRFWLNATKQVAATAEAGAALVDSHECRAVRVYRRGG